MKTDKDLRNDVIAELDWDPSFDSRNIGIAVKGGVVTLSGHVESYAQSWHAQKAAQSVSSVKAVANEIQVKLAGDTHRGDAEVAGDIVNSFNANVSVPVSTIKVSVRDGWVNLTGQASYWYQKTAAEQVARYVRGVRGIANTIEVKPPVISFTSAAEIKAKIESAFQRHAHRDADAIRVSVRDNAVVLEGKVPSWSERQAAEMAAWATPGVAKVDDQLIVSY